MYTRIKSSTPSDVIQNHPSEETEDDGEENMFKPPYVSIARDREKLLFRTALCTALLVCCYFVLSIGLTFYQRWLLKGYRFPFTVVVYHLLVKLMLSAFVRTLLHLFTGKRRIQVPFSVAVKKIAPTSFFAAVDIGFSQWGLEFVDVALYTMTKSTVIIFISFFAVLLKLEKKSWHLLVIVVMISTGLLLFTYKSTEFHSTGFSLLLIASCSSGCRWCLAQILMQKSKLELQTIDCIFYMQPYMLLSLLPFLIIFESERLASHFSQFIELEYYEVLVLWIKVSIGAFLAFFMEISEFLILSQTSSLTLSVSGIFKEILQLVLAVEMNGETLSFYNILGLILSLVGITTHLIYKYWILSNSSGDVAIDCHDKDNKAANELNALPTSSGNRRNVNVVISYQKTPLLNYSDESEWEEDDENRSAEVLFDILQRRDETRK